MTTAVSSTGSTSAAGSSPTSLVSPGGTLDKDDFLQLLVAQLKHQDPMNPMDSTQTASQLAQYSSLEQLINISGQIEGQSSLIQSLNNASAANVLGRTVIATGDQVVVPEGGDASVLVGVGGAGGRATLRIYDENGAEVGSRDVGYVGPGRQEIALGSAADGLAPGAYRYALEVTTPAGTAVETQTYVRGRVDSLQYTAQGAVFTLGPITVSVGAVVEVEAGM